MAMMSALVVLGVVPPCVTSSSCRSWASLLRHRQYSTSIPRFHSKKQKSSSGSSSWMRRHVQDEYVKRAQKDGHVSRAVYKLQQMDEKHGIFTNAHKNNKPQTVLDLGAAPGGWTSYVVDRLSAGSTVIAVDLLPLDAVVMQKLQRQEPQICRHVLLGDFQSHQVQSSLQDILRENDNDDGSTSSKGVSVVLSDMAANTMGDTSTDALRTMALCESAFDMAIQILDKRGSFVGKYFSCPDEKELRERARDYFDKVHVVKPKASRSASVERYLVAKGYKR